MSEELRYLQGLGAAHTSEALEGAVPWLQNSPRKLPYGLHAEQINGTPFTVPRAENKRAWMYRIRPSVIHGEPVPIESAAISLAYLERPACVSLTGWRPRALPEGGRTDFLDGLGVIAGAGDPSLGRGLAFYSYAADADMEDAGFCDADGDLMILPDTGALRVRTEYGWLGVAPGELAVIGRGMPFSVALEDGPVRGFVMEIYARHFELPQRGVIGANGLADERHFEVPTASYEDREVAGGFRLVLKAGGSLSEARRSHSPWDVVGWHGDYYPYKYDLSRFNAMGTVTWDHPDPSIYTVLSAPLDHPGANLADLVVFPNPRWDVAEHTLRPPYYHRNAATELNFIVKGATGPRVFSRGGCFLTPPFAAHGVGPDTIEHHYAMGDEEADRPTRIATDMLWMQFESALPLRLSPRAETGPERDPDFRSFASGARAYFDPSRRDVAIGRSPSSG